MTDLRKVHPGQNLQIPAETFTALVDAARDHQQRKRSQKAGQSVRQPNPGHILVRNDSALDVPRFGIVGLDLPIVFPSDDLAEFQNRPVLQSFVPDGTDHPERFAITQEPLAPGAIGRAALAGLTPVQLRIDDLDHNRAAIIDADNFHLATASTGPNRILWRDSGSVGDTVWALVHLAGGGGGLTICEDQNPDDFVESTQKLTILGDNGLSTEVVGFDPQDAQLAIRLPEGNATGGLLRWVADPQASQAPWGQWEYTEGTSGDEVYTSGTWRQAHLARVESDDFTTHYMTSGLGIYADGEALHIDETVLDLTDGTRQVDLLLRHHAPHTSEQQITVKDASGSDLTLVFNRFGHFTGTL